ncbi:hypothetical protein FPRO04_11838 [Fusarium proliferatum]|nr:hypothetical protein FPRO04_11838 [Fusarium proliferatum]
MDKDEKIVCSDMPADVEMASGNTEVIRSSGLKRELGSRHINMIAVAGMIGTGLFLSSGQVIATAGPVGALLAYTLMGFVTAGVAYTTGEITAFMPSTGGFVRHATKFVEPALGAATGWNFWYTMAINMPAEISAAATLVQFWNTSINPGVWITIFLLFIIVANLCGAKLYGESEVVFASLKIMLIIGLIIGGLVIDLGGAPNHERLGFRYWIHPGAFNTYIKDGSAGRFLAFWKAMLPAAFSYGNIQVVAISGSETRNPRKLIPAATKKTFYRIFFFYFCSIFIVGLIVPYNDPALDVSTGTASQSPFVIAFQRSGVSVVTYLRFFAGLKKQGYSREELPYKSPFQPYVAWATLLMVSLVILFCGFDVFVKGHFTAQGFITCYINIAIFAVLYAIFKLRLRSKVIPTSEIELSEEFRSIREEKQAEETDQQQK